MTETVGGVASTYAYSYDANGNLTKIMQGGEVLYEYRYDALGQLTYAADYVARIEYRYTYDKAGNLLSADGFTWIGTKRSWGATATRAAHGAIS